MLMPMFARSRLVVPCLLLFFSQSAGRAYNPPCISPCQCPCALSWWPSRPVLFFICCLKRGVGAPSPMPMPMPVSSRLVVSSRPVFFSSLSGAGLPSHMPSPCPCTYMCICVFLCVYVFMCVCMYVCIHVCVCAYVSM